MNILVGVNTHHQQHSANKVAVTLWFSGTCLGLMKNTMLFHLMRLHGLPSLEIPVEQLPISLVSNSQHNSLSAPATRLLIVSGWPVDGLKNLPAKF